MENKHKILIVDDAEINRSLLADMLSDDYKIMEASNGVEAISMLEKYHDRISLILLDIVMPLMDGFEVLAAMNRSGWINDIPVITISAETSSTYIDHAYDLGATDYINRPFDEKTVRRRVKNTVMLYAKQKMLRSMVTEQILEKERNNLLMVEILSNIVEFRNGESGLHVLHIRTITELLLKALLQRSSRYKFTASQISLIVNASALHDIGKISIPEQILNKPGKLTKEEFEIMKSHSAIGARILENTPHRRNEELIQLAHDICRWHHERYDGRGYPDGLKGEEIPIAAQVVSLADVYDALTGVRVYKPAYSHEKSIEMIVNGECGTFNPLLLDCLEDISEKLANELKIRSLGSATRIETQSMAIDMIASGDLHTSDRTLALLEQERIKYQFFAKMSREVQFEYSTQTKLLSVSEWGARQFGISELIAYPENSKELQHVFSSADYQDLKAKLNSTTPSDPVMSSTYCLNIGGQPRWCNVVARTMWSSEERPEMIGAIGKFVDVHEERMELDAFRQLATQDSLTELYNHRTARRMIEHAIESSPNNMFALLLFDLDYFKSANDRFGHMFGDDVLKHVADKISHNIRKDDIAARIGGDEFLIFMEYSDSLKSQLNRIFNALTGEYRGFMISVSMGIALYPQNGIGYEELFHCADQALYSSKKTGRNKYSFYDKSVQGFLSVLSPMDSEPSDNN